MKYGVHWLLIYIVLKNNRNCSFAIAIIKTTFLIRILNLIPIK